MLEGVTALIKPFVHHLPDMDLALNLNDECRVAIDWDNVQKMRDEALKGIKLDGEVDEAWTSERAAQWRDVEDQPTTNTRFEDHSFTNSFYSFSSRTCPPGSKARTQRIWNTGHLCVDCAAPHSHGPFLQNWTLAADICHQPDLADLHGFFLSPAAFKTTRDLMPVFSQSKVHGYNDIL
jgi:hypothetical protein